MSGRDKNYPVSSGSGAMGRLMSKIKRTVSESVSKSPIKSLIPPLIHNSFS